MAHQHLFALVEDLNGPTMYSSKRAMFGYIAPHERLQIPSWLVPGLRTGTQPQQSLGLHVSDVLEIASDNYSVLTGGGTPANDALWISLLRARWVQLGCLLQSRQDRAVPIDEVDVIQRPGSHKDAWQAANVQGNQSQAAWDAAMLAAADYGDAALRAFLPLVTQQLSQQINASATNLWALSAHIFRVRGHHYKQEFDDTITRTWKATTIDLPNTAPAWPVLIRTAIHPFGVRALADGFQFFLQNDALAPSFEVRKDAFPAGAAMIGTGYAVLQQMKSAAWWAEFIALYPKLVESVETQHQAIMQDPFAYHQAASLYNVGKKNLDDSAVRSLAPLLKGFITIEAGQTAIARQKTLDKHADQNPATRERFEVYLEMLLTRVKQAKSLAEALGSSAIPQQQQNP